MEGAINDHPDKDEKMLGMFAHLSIFLGALVIPIIFWLTNKNKSKFIEFHSLQAFWFQVFMIIIFVIFWLIMVAVFFVVGLKTGSLPRSLGNEMSPVFMIVLIVFSGILFLGMCSVYGYSVYMGVKTNNGDIVKYPVIGNKLYKKVYGVS